MVRQYMIRNLICMNEGIEVVKL